MSNEIGKYAAKRMRYYCESDIMGYDQGQRTEPDETDCSELYARCVDEALKRYGFPGINTASVYSGNICEIMKAAGAEILDFDGNIYDFDPGDGFVWEYHHVEMGLDNGEWGGANQDENGGIRGGKPGDQTGKEVYVKKPYNYHWNKIITWVNFDVGGAAPTEEHPERRIRVFTNEHGWLEWVTCHGCEDGCGDDFAGVLGCWIYGVEAENCGKLTVERKDGTTDQGFTRDTPITGIHLTDADYQVHWLGQEPGWGKVEHNDDDDGAGKDASSPLDMIRLLN